MKPLDIVAAAALILIWGVSYSVNKFAVAEIPPMLFLTARHALMAVLLAPMLGRLGVPFGRVVLVSTLLGVIHFVLFFAGLVGVTAGLSCLIVQMTVPVGSILAWFVYRERLSWLQGLGMAVAFFGVYYLTGRPELDASLPHVGLIALSAVAFAVANILIKRIGPIHPLRLNAWMSVIATPQVFVLMLALEHDHWATAMHASWQAWAGVAWTGVMGIIVGYGLWYRLLARYPVNRVVPLLLVIPALGILLAGLILGEPLTPAVLAGAGLTIVGVGLIQFGHPRRKGGTA